VAREEKFRNLARKVEGNQKKRTRGGAFGSLMLDAGGKDREKTPQTESKKKRDKVAKFEGSPMAFKGARGEKGGGKGPGRGGYCSKKKVRKAAGKKEFFETWTDGAKRFHRKIKEFRKKTSRQRAKGIS